MITTPIFTRLLTTQEYGEFNVFNSWLSIVTVFVTLNLYNGVFTRGLVKYEEDRDRYASALPRNVYALYSYWFCNLWRST